MEERYLTDDLICAFREHLVMEEKSAHTVEKYIRDIRAFSAFLNGKAVTKEMVMAYKQRLSEERYAVRSMNSMLASIHSFLDFQGWQDCRVKSLKLQRSVCCAEEKELTKVEYLRLLAAAKGQPRLRLILETICGTGIRVSELSYFTVESVRGGEISVQCKGKIRTILIPGKLRGLCCLMQRKTAFVPA